MSDYEFHPLANIFPLIDGQAYQDLMADILKHGVREPVWIYDGQILDGRNRYRAAKAMGVECGFRQYDGDEPVALIASLNRHRRHETQQQQAMSGARLADALSVESLARQQAGTLAPIGAKGKSAEKAAETVGVPIRTIERAQAILKTGSDELISTVERGAVSVSAAADVATLPKEQQREIVARGEREILQAAKIIRAAKADERRTERIEKIVEISRGNAPLGQVSDKYAVIYADPPWRYEHSETESRAIENHYPTMSLDEIKALPVVDIAYDDCILFLWATSPKLHESMQVLDAWGFSYRTCAVWDKQKIGMGYYFRQQHELLLVAVRGAPPTPRPGDRPSSVMSFERGPHSAKPLEVYEVIEAMYPELPKLEMFCRDPRDGWGVWGNQSKAA